MARLARIVIPDTPHFITQRGNRGQDVFFGEEDALAYMDAVSGQCARFGVEVWAYCLLPGRVHFLAVPSETDSLRLALGEAHRRYTNRINDRMGWTGHLWQSRFSSFPLEDAYILSAAHFIETSPVMSGLCKNASSFRWSSARAHIKGQDDALCRVAPLLSREPEWSEFLQAGPEAAQMQTIASHISTGRPLGGGAFIARLEERTGRTLQKKRPGRKPKTAARH